MGSEGGSGSGSGSGGALLVSSRAAGERIQSKPGRPVTRRLLGAPFVIDGAWPTGRRGGSAEDVGDAAGAVGHQRHCVVALAARGL